MFTRIPAKPVFLTAASGGDLGKIKQTPNGTTCCPGKGDTFLPSDSHQANKAAPTKSSSMRQLTWCAQVFTCFLWTKCIPGVSGKDTATQCDKPQLSPVEVPVSV